MSPSAELPELQELESLVEDLKGHARVRVVERVVVGQRQLPVWALTLGAAEAMAPCLVFVGGVHGLERIGTQVVLAYLRTLSVRLSWDRVLHDTLSRVRLLFVPLVNPGGMLLGRRGNPRGVDLMRNAPRGPGGRGTPLLGGQRISRFLPWYAGDPERAPEPESRALIKVVQREIGESRVALAMDCHSGFGMVDRIWFPYARTRRPFPHLAEVVGIKRLLDTTLPNHVYRIEPQAHAYTIQGDVWDHLYDRQLAGNPDAVFVPLTLEMGSWAWVRKNPRQIWSIGGSFNPVLPHRLKRTLRRHLSLFDFLLHAIASDEAWRVSSLETRVLLENEAFTTWRRT